MFEFGKQVSVNKYKNIIGDTKATIEAIQKYINNYSSGNTQNSVNEEEKPAESINRILESTICEETNNEIQKIINNL
ncbi:MAG: hypothetical protein LUH05_09760 [Candidatus Gastranaerophilales bacterium]|nr:hypothetical protein [Candidatus Gastranaerophilales bacterium]